MTQADTGPGLSAEGFVWNQLALHLDARVPWVALVARADQETLAFTELAKPSAAGSVAASRLELLPLVHHSLGPLELSGGAGYAFAQLPTFNSSVQEPLHLFVASRQALAVGINVGIPVAFAQLEAWGRYFVPLHVNIPGPVTSSGYAVGAGVSAELLNLGQVGLGARLDVDLHQDSLGLEGLGGQTHVAENAIRGIVGLEVLLRPIAMATKAPRAPLASPEPPAPTAATLQIRLEDARTHSPIARAALMFRGTTYYANEQGVISLVDLPAGEAALVAEHPGYSPERCQVVLLPGQHVELVIPMKRRSVP
jgi:hypothetical protein